MQIEINSKTQRSRLEPRKEPYWSRLKAGFHLGYRKHEQGDGTWIARLREDNKQTYHALGAFDDYDDAKKAAEAWLAQREQGVIVTDTTVSDACKQYVKHLRTKNGASSAKDAEGRFNRLVHGASIGKKLLSKLLTSDVRDWVNNQLATGDDDDDEDLRRSKDSTNRNLATLKAALNLALKDRLVATDAGWKTITPFLDVARSREHLLTQDERAALLKACPDDLALLVKGLLLTGARPGELAKAKAGDFDKKQGTIALDGKTGRRIATLSSAARVFFSEQVKDKHPTASLLATSYGTQWNKDDWKKPFRAAAKKAKLSDCVVMYHLRHAAISDMILSGIQSSVVALLTGTSTAMIDKHYGHLNHAQTRMLLDRMASA